MNEQGVIFPTVGRKVWYRPSADEIGMGVKLMQVFGETAQPCDATVVYVHDARTVNLAVIDHYGKQHFRQNVPLVQPGDDTFSVSRPRCEWMPYQKGQAAKAEMVAAGVPSVPGMAYAERLTNGDLEAIKGDKPFIEAGGFLRIGGAGDGEMGAGKDAPGA